MNFLAHLALAEDDPESLIGSVLPDLVRVRQAPGRPPHVRARGEGESDWVLSPRMWAAVQQHRQVDAFTDSHPIVQRSKDRLRPRHGLFTPIIVDMLYDHLLAADFTRYHRLPLAAFVTHVHEAMSRQVAHLPPAAQPIIQRMVQQDWLSSYASVEGLSLALLRMSRRFMQRFERPVQLEKAIEDLLRLRVELAEDFHEFFPLLVQAAGQGTAPPKRHGTEADAKVIAVTGMVEPGCNP